MSHVRIYGCYALYACNAVLDAEKKSSSTGHMLPFIADSRIFCVIVDCGVSLLRC
jgi:hypothetical protein